MDTKNIILIIVASAMILLPEPVTTAAGTALGLAILAGIAGVEGGAMA